ncbi:MAG TPA: type II secretion system protein [Gemmatimonadales bacterium]|nr:type II secretion system protein [Gemmatimonadales bacterium]
MRLPTFMCGQHCRLDRTGTTLIELMIVVGIVGIVTLFAVPSVARTLDQVQGAGARTALVNLYHGARTSARVSNRMTVLRVAQNRLILERNSPSGAAKDTLSVTDLLQRYGVLVSGPDSIRIDPRGVLETNLRIPVKFVLVRGAWSDSVVLSSYGRIMR